MVEPALSAILVTPDDWKNMRNTLQALRGQTMCEQIELVLVGPSRAAITAPEPELNGFAAVRYVWVPDFRMLGQAYAAGVRAATAPLVAFTEDHSYPEPEWAASFCRRHASGNWAAVGPSVVNANPSSLASWAQFIIEYGSYDGTHTKGSCRQIPGHNSCYRRDVLLQYEPELANWLECETLMHWDMANRGLGLYLDPQACTHHWNCSRMLPTLLFAWYFSREFAAYRIRHMTLLQRAKLALLWPLIPVVRLKRIWPCMTSMLGYPLATAALPAVAMNLLVSGAGEGLGYTTGKVGNPQKCLDWEFHRERFLRRGEQLVLRTVPGESAVSTTPGHRPVHPGTTSAIELRSKCEAEVQST